MTLHKLHKHCQQRGIATLLVVVLMGFTMMAIFFSVTGLIRSSQEQGMALHTSTQSQAKAWANVEVVRRYLFSILESDDWDDLASAIANAATTPVTITLSGSGISDVTASIVDYDASETPTEYVTVNISAVTDTGTKGAASSTIQVVYRKREPQSSQPESNNVLVFNSDLVLDSSVELINTTGKVYNLNVAGSFTSRSTVIGFDVINSEENVLIESNAEDIGRIVANGDVKIDGNLNASSGSTEVFARGNICLYSNAFLRDEVKANGSIYTNTGGAYLTDVTAIGSSDWSGTQLCGSPSYAVDIDEDTTNIISEGDVNLRSISVNNISAEGNITGSSVSGGTVSGSNGPNNSVIEDPSHTVSITPVEELTISVEIARFNALDHTDSVNYYVKRDSGKTKVVVKNVDTISDGEYFLRSRKLCTADNDSTCVAGFLLCGTSDCFNYSSGTWTIKDAKTTSSDMLVQGVIMVDGNLKLEGEGLYYNTFMAEGNIVVDGNHTIYAPNYAGYDGNTLTYDNALTGLTGNVQGMCPNALSGRAPVSSTFYPTSHCDTVTPEYLQDFGGGIGNFSLAAGSDDDPADLSTYTGGDITIIGNVTQYGSLIAGNTAIADSNIEIFGYVTAESNRTSGAHTLASNIMVSTTTLGTYTPGNEIYTNIDPLMVDVFWSRYL